MTTQHRSTVRLLFAASAAVLSVAALGLVLVYRTSVSEQFRKQTADNCRQIENLKTAITGVLVDSKLASLDRNTDPALRKAIEHYYTRQLARFAPDKCPNG